MAHYTLHTQHNGPNHGSATVPSPCREVVLHWWGNPSGQDPWGIVAWLYTPASQVSAHAVVWPGNVACILPYAYRSWANGNDWANNVSITLECDPNHVTETIPTAVAYLADLIRDGVLHPDFRLTGHRDHYSTACPGDYYPLLPSIRQQVSNQLTNTPEDDMQLTDDFHYTDPNGKVTKTNLGEAINWIIRNQDALNTVVFGKGIPMIGTDERTDLATEAAWGRQNKIDLLKASGFTDADIQKILDAMADAHIDVDVRVHTPAAQKEN